MNRKVLVPALGLALAGALAAASPAAAPKPKGKPTSKPAAAAPANEVKGQGQMAGANGQFGTIYTLKSGFNFEILSARYTAEPFVSYSTKTAKTDEKLLVLDIAIKNANPSDDYINTEGLFTLADDKNQTYTAYDIALQSLRSAAPNMTLRPGQGLGQPGLKDPLQVGFVVPGKARLVKIILNQGRKGRDEDVIRYYIAGATKEEAGEAGDPKNVIAPLPDNLRDPADPSGAVALAEGKGTSGAWLPSGSFALRLDSFAFTSDPIVGGAAPEDGKKYAVATVTAKLLTDESLSMFDVTGGDNPLHELTDTDGERYKPSSYRKAVADEDAEHSFKTGDEYKFRIVWTVPKAATMKKLLLGTGGARQWAYDVSAVK